MRVFISLNLSEEKKREVFEIQNEVKKLLGFDTINSIKWEGRDKFHQTIFFLGDVGDNIIRNISTSLEKIKSEINFNEIEINNIFMNKILLLLKVLPFILIIERKI